MVGMPLCLNATVTMLLLSSYNAPIAKLQCTHILEHCGCNAPLLDGMPHFSNSWLFNVRIIAVLLPPCIPVVLVSSGNIYCM